MDWLDWAQQRKKCLLRHLFIIMIPFLFFVFILCEFSLLSNFTFDLFWIERHSDKKKKKRTLAKVPLKEVAVSKISSLSSPFLAYASKSWSSFSFYFMYHSLFAPPYWHRAKCLVSTFLSASWAMALLGHDRFFLLVASCYRNQR